jgi:hypothetical protein
MSGAWRAARRSAGCRLILAALLLCFAGGTIHGCRDNGTPLGPGTSPAFRLRVSVGDRFLYNGWEIDWYGYRIESTATRHTWLVISTAGQIAGFSDVIVIIDSAVTRTTSALHLDTLYFRSAADGSLYRYGFLTELILRREKRLIQPRWDLLIFPEAGSSGSWTVGPTDSLGTQKVTGTIEVGEDYFDVAVNGVRSAYQARRCDLLGPALEFYLWMADSPSSLPRMEEYPDPYNEFARGSVLILSDIVTARNQ